MTSASDRYRQAAEHAASVLYQRFLDGQRGGFFDIQDTPDRPGYLQIREKPLAENVATALGMMRLSHITFEERYLHTAHHTLSAYVDANRDYGELAADYAIAVDRYLNPVVEVTVEGRPGTPDADAMLAAAMELDSPTSSSSWQPPKTAQRRLSPRLPGYGMLSAGIRPVGAGRCRGRRHGSGKPFPERPRPLGLTTTDDPQSSI